MFRHRLGMYPSLTVILASMPILREDKIPTDGIFPAWSIGKVKEQMAKNKEGDTASESAENDDDQYSYSAPLSVRAEDTDAILVDRSGGIILQELVKFDAVAVPRDGNAKSSIAGDITAKWNREERRGEFVVRIFHRDNDRFVKTLGPLLAAWFDVAPFPLTALGRNLKATSNIGDMPYTFPFPPFDLKKKERAALADSVMDEMTEAVENYNNENESNCAKLSLQSSFGGASSLGGVCPTDTGFVAFLQRYFAEILPDHGDMHVKSSDWTINQSQPVISWLGRAAGITSHHRVMYDNKKDGDRKFRYLSLESFVQEQDVPLAFMNLPGDGLKTMQQTTTSINGILIHLENLGHEEAPFIEGLNVELLPFQRQTLQWALDRETTSGGLQSFISAKLPLTEDVYYHPVFESVSNRKPKLVRGGIIADEMGLGKTVVSLALILQNPAPLKPASGSKSEMLTSNSSESSAAGWDCDWQPDEFDEFQNPLKASIVSRGTLVVCHVSLVSQWIDEAKSKLNNPGLVYAYHGQNRKREALILARNAIIVTTYATLAKDATYHAGKAKKNGESDYCPPCEQIRWWRIICDESHTLREPTVQTKAVMNLVGDHKWAVSGTPWSTSLVDIKNQLKFVGVEGVDRMFNQFQNRVFEHLNQANRRGCNSNRKVYEDSRRLGHFLFLMRAVMIRHSQKQQYRGTSTTLMSLPLKTERTIEIDFEPHEVAEYARLKQDALDFYRAFEPRHSKELSRHYFKLMQKLAPVRIACAGGKIPITADSDKSDDRDSSKEKAITLAQNAKAEDDDRANDVPANPKQKKVQEFSQFRFQSKFNVLIEELRKIRDDEPESKSLVFSQYASSLKFLQEELPKHGFQYRTLTGDMTLKQRAEALHAFKEDPPTTIFLLSMRSGAVGINLTQANRVFLLEPAINPALAAQAIGRVYRLGQTRNVEIIRLLMKDSIETRISQLIDKKHPKARAAANETGEGLNENDVAATPPPAATTGDVVTKAPIVGSVRTDKAIVFAAEFDLLFGLKCSLNPAPLSRFHATVAMKTEDDDEEDDFLMGDEERMDDCDKAVNRNMDAGNNMCNRGSRRVVGVTEEADYENSEEFRTAEMGACAPERVSS